MVSKMQVVSTSSIFNPNASLQTRIIPIAATVRGDAFFMTKKTQPITFDNRFSLCLPNEDWTIYEDELFTIFDGKHGVGTLQISLFNSDEKLGSDVLSKTLSDIVTDYQRDNGLNAHFIITKKANSVASHFQFSEKSEDNASEIDNWRIWHILNANTLLFISYNCAEADMSKEQKAIDSIIDSIQFTP